MSRPSKYSPHILITDEDIAMHRAVRSNLFLSLAATALLWAFLVSYTLQNGINLITAYLFFGSLEAVRNLALVPVYFIDRKNPALYSLYSYGKYLVAWLPMALRSVYHGVSLVLRWDDDDFRVQRMMNRIHIQEDNMTEEEWDATAGPEGG